MQSFQDLRALAFVERDLVEHRAVQFVRHRAKGDVAAALAMMASHAVYAVPGDSQFAPCFGSYVGADAVRRFLAQCHVEFQVHKFDILDVMVDADRAIVRSKWKLRHRGTGVCKTFEGCDIITFENGLIVSIRCYVDSLALVTMSSSES